jgi:hypothetical protein
LNPFHRFTVSPFHLSTLISIAMLTTACGDQEVEGRATQIQASGLEQADAPRVRGEGLPQLGLGEEVYFMASRFDAAGELVSQEERGKLDEAIRQRAARPWTYRGVDEPWLYEEHVWTGGGEDGGSEHGYQVFRRPNARPVIPEPERGPTRVDEQLWRDADALEDDEALVVGVKLRDFPEWDIPLMPSALTMSAADHALHLSTRTRAEQARQSLMQARSAPLTQWLESVGGEVVASFWASGWLSVKLPRRALKLLIARPELISVNSNTITDGDNGTFRIGEAHTAPRLNIVPFYSKNILGEFANSNRHSHGAMMGGIAESFYISTSARVLLGYNFATSNFFQRGSAFYDCKGSSCVSGTTYTNDALNCQNGVLNCISGTNIADHGTWVASVMLGDYRDGQGDGHALNDPSYNATTQMHSSLWENSATGIARRARFYFYGGMSQNSTAFQNSYARARLDKVDVLNLSHGLANSDCDIKSSRSYEDELEVGYDDGVFIVESAGNNNTVATNLNCNINAPADTPKVFTVNGLDTTNNDCHNSYQNCLTAFAFSGTANSATGGMDAKIGGQTFTDVVTGIDLTAPAFIQYTTNSSAAIPNGFVDTSGGYIGGTSFAAPLVSGAALLLKESFLRIGGTWINSPGRLFVSMLAMGDSWMDEINAPLNYGTDIRSGVGRLNMRLLIDPSNPSNPTLPGIKTRAMSFAPTSAGEIKTVLWSDPLATGTELLKCVLHEQEDMSGKDNVSDVYLGVQLLYPVNGVCVSNGTPYSSARIDASRDLKHMVRFSQQNLGGLCPVVTTFVDHVSTAGHASHLVFCYASHTSDQD